MEPTIGLASGAEDNELATWLSLQLEGALHHPKTRRDFLALRAAIAMVAPDRRLHVTLRFDLGVLTIHDGMIGIPDVTFCGDYPLLLALAELPITRFTRLPLPGWPTSKKPRALAWRRTVLELVSGELKIYGLLAHPRTVVRLLRLLAKRL